MEPILEIYYEEEDLTMNNDISRIVILEIIEKSKKNWRHTCFFLNVVDHDFTPFLTLKMTKAVITGDIWDNHENSFKIIMNHYRMK